MEERFATLLADYCLELKPGQTLLVEAEPAALPLLEPLHAVALERGAYPIVQLFPAASSRPFFLYGEAWLDVPPAQLGLMRAVDASLRIESAQNPLELSDIPPERLSRFRKGWQPYQQERSKRRWCLTLYPTPGYAQQAGMPTAEFRTLVERALYLDHPDPVLAWLELSRFQAALIERLQRAREIRLEAEGTDLRLRVEGRSWVNSDGRRNMPSGEVFTAPIETSVEGEVRFNLPSTALGQRVRGVHLRFQAGRVVEARAEEGEAYLRAMLETDAGARCLGELGIGTNYGLSRPTGLVLYDEKIGGTVHLALGQSYPETGGTNVSAIHWDLVLDLRPGGRIWVDGEVLQEDGRFVGL
ncbi:aminopeptidase [Meiothermus sp. QL-1]|uniref:aminopeptidase n=1 Tax=Meiothermus sp. QL-1 TaxID=2058095 RepID=UPI000E0BBD17|nr:aminopeptidase [Meiothermus sp. QL-1]RDI95735.1 aminopeptidase [Meiothermus sp. QL-1]